MSSGIRLSKIKTISLEEAKQGKIPQIEEHDGSIENILDQFVDINGICKTCGQDHRCVSTFKDVKTTIDIITELFHKKEHLEVSEC